MQRRREESTHARNSSTLILFYDVIIRGQDEWRPSENSCNIREGMSRIATDEGWTPVLGVDEDLQAVEQTQERTDEWSCGLEDSESRLVEVVAYRKAITKSQGMYNRLPGSDICMANGNLCCRNSNIVLRFLV